jgi:hypothetical protein
LVGVDLWQLVNSLVDKLEMWITNLPVRAAHGRVDLYYIMLPVFNKCAQEQKFCLFDLVQALQLAQRKQISARLAGAKDGSVVCVDDTTADT